MARTTDLIALPGREVARSGAWIARRGGWTAPSRHHIARTSGGAATTGRSRALV